MRLGVGSIAPGAQAGTVQVTGPTLGTPDGHVRALAADPAAFDEAYSPFFVAPCADVGTLSAWWGESKATPLLETGVGGGCSHAPIGRAHVGTASFHEVAGLRVTQEIQRRTVIVRIAWDSAIVGHAHLIRGGTV